VVHLRVRVTSDDIGAQRAAMIVKDSFLT